MLRRRPRRRGAWRRWWSCSGRRKAGARARWRKKKKERRKEGMKKGCEKKKLKVEFSIEPGGRMKWLA